jgi:hypothetical protein
MTRCRLIAGILLALFAVGAVATSTAQAEEAPSWTVNGTRLGAGQTHFITVAANTTSELTVEGSGVKVKCTKVSTPFEGAVLLGSSAGEPGTNNEKLEFSGCTVEGNGAKCSLAKESFATNPLRSELVEDGKKENQLVEFKPVSGTAWATLKFEGKECKVSETKVSGSAAAEVLTTGEKPIKVSERIASEKWLFRFPSKAIGSVFLIKAGVGKEEKITLEAFAEKATLASTMSIALAGVTEGKLFSADEVAFDTEKGWHAEAKGGGEFDITSNSKVTCEKETFEGASPTSGFSTTSDMAPAYGGCKFEIEKEKGVVTKTNAEVKARGCDFEYLGDEEPGSGKFKSEFDISKCSEGEKGGILITDTELEAGKTCEVNMPDQATGKEDEDTDTHESSPFESEGKIDATDVKADITGCPEEIEKGKEPQPFVFVFIVVPRIIFVGLYFFVFFF